MDNPVCFFNVLLYLIANEKSAGSCIWIAFASSRLLDSSSVTIISFLSGGSLGMLQSGLKRLEILKGESL